MTNQSQIVYAYRWSNDETGTEFWTYNRERIKQRAIDWGINRVLYIVKITAKEPA